MENSKIILLVGLPGAGKSTWTREYLKSNPNTVVVSSDDLIEEFAKENSLTYSEAFKLVNQNEIEKAMMQRFNDAVAEDKDIIVDRTNMTSKGRNKFLSKVSSKYIKTAIVFDVPQDVVESRLKSRAEQTGKVIPEFVVRSMRSNFQRPTLDEFDVIRLVTA